MGDQPKRKGRLMDDAPPEKDTRSRNEEDRPKGEHRPPPPSSGHAVPSSKARERQYEEARRREEYDDDLVTPDLPSADEGIEQVKHWNSQLKKFLGFAKHGDTIDLYRDTPVRFLGYSEEIGEAFRPVLPRWVVRSTYGITCFYILADTIDKTAKVTDVKWETRKVRQREIEKTIVDTLAWQALASVFIPGFVISRTCQAFMYVVEMNGKLPTLPRTVATAAICFTLIPLIMRPVDIGTDMILDHTLRKIIKRRPVN